MVFHPSDDSSAGGRNSGLEVVGGGAVTSAAGWNHHWSTTSSVSFVLWYRDAGHWHLRLNCTTALGTSAPGPGLPVAAQLQPLGNGDEAMVTLNATPDGPASQTSAPASTHPTSWPAEPTSSPGHGVAVAADTAAITTTTQSLPTMVG